MLYDDDFFIENETGELETETYFTAEMEGDPREYAEHYIDKAVRKIIDLQAQAKAFKEEEEILKAKRQRADNQISWLKSEMWKALDFLKQKSVVTSIRKVTATPDTQSVEVDQEAIKHWPEDVVAACVKNEVVSKLYKEELKLVKGYEELPGVTVKTKHNVRIS